MKVQSSKKQIDNLYQGFLDSMAIFDQDIVRMATFYYKAVNIDKAYAVKRFEEAGLGKSWMDMLYKVGAGMLLPGVAKTRNRYNKTVGACSLDVQEQLLAGVKVKVEKHGRYTWEVKTLANMSGAEVKQVVDVSHTHIVDVEAQVVAKARNRRWYTVATDGTLTVLHGVRGITQAKVVEILEEMNAACTAGGITQAKMAEILDEMKAACAAGGKRRGRRKGAAKC